MFVFDLTQCVQKCTYSGEICVRKKRFLYATWQQKQRCCRWGGQIASSTSNSLIQCKILDATMGKILDKKISKLNKVPHPKGRKAAQLSKKAIKEAGREKIKLLHHIKENLIGEKLLWFKENLDPVENYTPELTIKLIERYLCRFDEELEQIQLKHTIGKRKGRQHANREDIIKMTVKNEKNQFSSCGIEMPDVLNSKQLTLLRNWSGELRYIQNFSLVRYSRSKLEKMKSRKHLNSETKEKDTLNVDIAEDQRLLESEDKLEGIPQQMEFD